MKALYFALLTVLAAARPGMPTVAQVAPRTATDSIYVPILVYHGVFPHHPGQTPDQIQYDVAPENFATQMTYLRDNGYHVISLLSYVDALIKGTPVAPKSVVITLDDGQKSVYVHAFPVLRKLGFTATFFIYPSAMESGKPEFMRWEEVRDLQKGGMDIGSHAYDHPYLNKLTDPKTLNMEIVRSKATLEKQLGVPIDLFAYPFGAHKAPRDDSLVKAAGYKAARGFPGGGWNSQATLFAMRSFMITDNMNAFKRDLDPPASRSAGRGARQSLRFGVRE